MVDVLGFDIPVSMPKFAMMGAGRITLYLAIFILLIAGAIVIWLVYQWRIYKYKIIVFENISGQGYQVAFKDRARVLKLGGTGEEVLYLRKKRVYRSAYGRKMGRNTFWFAIGQDGYWYNFILGDLDAKMGMLDIEPVDRDMRYMYVAIAKNIRDTHLKKNFMEKYGTIVVSGVFLIIILIGMWFIISKMGDVSANLVGAIKTMGELMETNKQIVQGLQNLQAGSGFISGG
ncbi:hypothetical protein AYK24_09845 [Thermoplasmatales archaeon SG8-52-4]|nr:MAG: hypothetical protein AYK24_09845 [Thermoplasmatales archaeon SG8-52-4]